MKAAIWIGIAALLIICSMLLLRSRYQRVVVLEDLGTAQTQAVRVSFQPVSMEWRVTGNIAGTGAVAIPFVFSNTVSGPVSAKGSCDYYERDASVLFIPHGRANGLIRVTFKFGQW